MIVCGGDPGHGGSNNGAYSPSGMTREADLTAAVAREIERQDPSVILTRTCDTTISYPDRAIKMAAAGVQFVAAWHYDSTPWAPTKHGCHLYHARGDSVSREVANFALAQVSDELRGGRVICAHDDPMDKRDDWKKHAQYICEVYQCPTLLFEFGYLSNRRDLEYLISSYGIADCAALVLQSFDKAKTLLGARNAPDPTPPLDPLSNL